MIYRYYMPTWDPTLFPVTGCERHFLGLLEGGQGQGEGLRLVTVLEPKRSCIYQFLITGSGRLQVNGALVTDYSQTLSLSRDKSYPLIFDWWTGDETTLQVSVDGSPWNSIPFSMIGRSHHTSMIGRSHHTSMIEYAFNRMNTASYYGDKTASAEDSNQVFQNMDIVDAAIGRLEGRQCMIVDRNRKGSGSGLFNCYGFHQGIRLHAMKSITMMVMVSDLMATPTLYSFYNCPDTNIAAYPRRGWNPTITKKTSHFELVVNKFPTEAGEEAEAGQGHMLNVYSGGMAGEWRPYTLGKWTHIAFVWVSAGVHLVYVDGVPGKTLKLDAYGPDIIMEQMRIGCAEGASWTGGIAWWRAFDYPLGPELVTRDMDSL